MSLHAVPLISAGSDRTAEMGAGGTSVATSSTFVSTYSRQPLSGEGGSEKGYEQTNATWTEEFAPWTEGATGTALVMFEIKIDADTWNANGFFDIRASDGTTLARIDCVSGAASTAFEVWSGDTLTSRGTTDETAPVGEYVQIAIGFKTGATGDLFVVVNGVSKTFISGADVGTTKTAVQVVYKSLQGSSGAKDAHIPAIYVFDDLTDQADGTVMPFPGAAIVPTSDDTTTNWADELGGTSNLYTKVANAPSVYVASTYLETSTAGADLLFGCAVTAVFSGVTPDEILGVVVSAIVERSGSGITQVRMAQKLSGTTEYGTTVALADSVVTRVSHCFPTKAGGGAYSSLTDITNSAYGLQPVA